MIFSKKIKSNIDFLKQHNIDPGNVPQHVAIIMDGNGRWAKKRFMPRNFGHKAGAEALKKTIKAAVEIGIKELSMYVFSTENWKRPQAEVDFLMNYLKELIPQEAPKMQEQDIKLRVLGDLSVLKEDVQQALAKVVDDTKNNQKLALNLMVNYGGRNEIISACKSILEKKIKPENLNEKEFEKYLYTKDCYPVDILIRTGGDIRISNFLLWQCAYAELFFLSTLWPDFNRSTLVKVICEFQKRDRRFGGLK